MKKNEETEIAKKPKHVDCFSFSKDWKLSYVDLISSIAKISSDDVFSIIRIDDINNIVIKIRANHTPKEMIINEVKAIEYIKKHTTIPVPSIIEYNED